MISTISSKKKRSKIKLWAAVVWLLIWQAASMCIGQEILLVSPVSVILRLFELVRTMEFWQSLAVSFVKILSGFLLGTLSGVTAAGLAARFRRVDEFLEPFVQTIKAVPVASFIILVLIWISPEDLSVIISFLMVFPVIYTNVKDGIRSLDRNLTEMARVFRIPAALRIRYIYVSQILPFFRAGCSLALGLCWKSGIAAEVIGLPEHTIGENLYNAKIYLNTPDLFAWTLVIVVISVLFEKVFLRLIDCGMKYVEKMSRAEKYNRSGRKPHPGRSGEKARFTPEKTIGQSAEPVESAGGSAAGDIRIRNLSKSYGDEKVLDAFSADIPGGKTTCIMGPSGCGKTTLLRILMGLEQPDAGSVEGMPDRISAVFQEDRLCSRLTAVTNIRLICPGRPEPEVKKGLDYLGLGGQEDQPVCEYSGGMRQRTSILRALYADSEILILDEPFKGLDKDMRRKTADFILEMAAGRTVICVTHDQGDVRLLDAVQVIRLGKA